MLTQDDLNTIKERAKKATFGPWYVDDERWPGNANLQYWFNTHYDGVGAAATKADAEFIAHAREDIPRLVAEVERLREGLSAIAEDYNAYDSPDQLAEVAEYYLNGGVNE